MENHNNTTAKITSAIFPVPFVQDVVAVTVLVDENVLEMVVSVVAPVKPVTVATGTGTQTMSAVDLRDNHRVRVKAIALAYTTSTSKTTATSTKKTATPVS